jgi:hypothetical protein
LKNIGFILFALLLTVSCCSQANLKQEIGTDSVSYLRKENIPDTIRLIAYAINLNKVGWCGKDTFPVTSLDLQFDSIKYVDSLKCTYYNYYFYHGVPSLNCYVFNCFCTIIQDSLGRITFASHYLIITKFKTFNDVNEYISKSIKELNDYISEAEKNKKPITKWLAERNAQLRK